jgi:Uma2 family endonuclease
MASATATAPPQPTPPTHPIETLADLLDRLGNIPLRRIQFHPPPGTATEADVLAALAAPRRRVCELIDGVLVEKPMGYSESVVAAFVTEKLNCHVRPRNLGLVSGEAGTMRLFSGRVRIPDVAFVSWDRLPGRRRPPEPIPDLVPDLAVEVLSESNTPREMELKRQEYFGGGTQLVWEIDPETRTARAYTAPEVFTALTAVDALDGALVLPGFTLPLADVFAELDRQG